MVAVFFVRKLKKAPDKNISCNNFSEVFLLEKRLHQGSYFAHCYLWCQYAWNSGGDGKQPNH